MVTRTPLRLIAGGRDVKIDRPGDARASGAFSNDIRQAL
jgi:hypothetical protein